VRQAESAGNYKNVNFLREGWTWGDGCDTRFDPVGNDAGFRTKMNLNMKLKQFCLLMAGLLPLGAMAQGPAPTMMPPGAGLNPAPEAVKPDKDNFSLAAGIYYAGKATNEMASQLGVDVKTDIDLAKLVLAFSNAVAGTPGTMAFTDASKVMQQQYNFQKGLTQEVIKKMTDAGPQTKAASDKFMETITSAPDVTKLASGVAYKVLKQGDGEMPAMQDIVTVSFKLSLIDGSEVTSVEHRQMSLTPTAITAGLAQAMQSMKAGSHWIVYVPYTQGFDDKPQIPDAKRGYKVPPYSALVFDTELESVQHHPSAPPTSLSAPAPGPTTMPNVTSSSIVRVPSAEDMKKGEQPRVLTDAEVEAARKEAMQKAAQTNGTAPK
jgi:FKBP-type peptidyl-prolyl cis-trans isomerase